MAAQVAGLRAASCPGRLPLPSNPCRTLVSTLATSSSSLCASSSRRRGCSAASRLPVPVLPRVDGGEEAGELGDRGPLDISEIRQPEAPSEAAGIRYSPHHAALSRASRPLPFRSASTRADAAAIASAACRASCACRLA